MHDRAYALGMGLLVGTAAVAVALAKSSLIDRLRRGGRFVPTLAGALMIFVGAYVVYYGLWDNPVLGGAATDDPVINAAARIQQAVSNVVSAFSIGWLVVIVFLVLGAVTVIAAWRLRLARPRQRM